MQNNNYPYGNGYSQTPAVIGMKLPNMNQAPPQRKDPFAPLQGYYQYTLKPNMNPQLDSAVVNLNSAEIQIDFPVNPQQPPIVYYLSNQLPYESFFKWNFNILDLVNAVGSKIVAMANPLLQDLIELKNSIKEDDVYRKLQQCSLKELLPSLLPSDYPTYLEKSDQELKELLRQQPDYSQLVMKLFSLVQQNEIIAEQIVEQDAQLAQQKELLLAKYNQFATEKETYSLQSSLAKSLSERFENSKIVQQLEKKVEQLEDAADTAMEQGLSRDGFFEEDVASYFQKRKAYNKVSLICQKFRQQNGL